MSGRSPSSRSTPACRSSTRSPRRRRTSTWSRRSCTWRPAAGSKGPKPPERGHAVEARLNAEDPDRDFAPSPGRIALLDLPSGPGIRVDTGVGEGDTIPADFDSMIAKIIAYGRTRDEALARLRRAMAETTVVIEGGATNKSFILDLLDQSEVVDGEAGWADTSWIDRVRAEGRLVVHEHSGIAVVAAGIEAYEDEAQVEITRLLESAHGGRPQVQHKVGRAVDFKLRGTAYKVTVLQIGPHRFRVGVAAGGVEHVVVADVERLDEFHTRMTVGDQRYRLVTATHGPVHMVEVDGVAHRVSRDEGGVLRSPAPALVVASPVAVGDLVAAGAPVLVLESMKMETVLRAPFAARVRELLVLTGSQVETGAPLVRLEPVEEDAAEEAAPPDEAGPVLDLPPSVPAASAQERAARSRDDVAAMLMGYDVDPQRGRRRHRRLPRRPRRARGGGRGRRGRRDRAARPVRRPRRAQPQPPRRGGPAHRAARAQLEGALPRLPAEPRRGPRRAPRAVPRPPGQGARPLRRDRPGPDPAAGGGGVPDLPGAAALRPRGPAGDRAAPALDRRAAAGRGAGRPGARPPRAARQVHPAPVPGGRRPGPQHPLPLVRPAAGRRRALERAGRRPRRGGGPRGRPRRPGPDRAAGGAGRDPGADRAVPRGAARGRRAGAGADARGAGAPPLPRARPARPAVVRARRVAPSRWPTTSSTTAPPGWSPPSAPSPSSATRTARWSRPSATRSPPVPAGHEVVRRPLRALAGRPGGAGAGQRGARPHRRRPALRPRRTPDRGGGLPRRGTGRSTTSPTVPPPTAGSSRTTWSAACTRWSAAGSTCGGCATSTSPASRRPRTCSSTSASRGRTPPTAGSSPWPRSVSSPSSATRRAGSPACPTRSGRWRTASRRSAASVRRAARPGASSTPTTCGCRCGRSSRPTWSS